MKLNLYYFQSQKEAWSEQALELYKAKLQRFGPFEAIGLKAKSMERSRADKKLLAEEQILLKHIEPGDELVLFDVRGQKKNSEDFSNFLQKRFESGKAKLNFVIGGAYGFSETLRERANHRISFSDLTMNHHVALVVALEQLYRAPVSYTHLTLPTILLV